MSSPRNLTVRGLLGVPQLGLKLVIEGDLDHRVRGAHSVEIEGAGKWLRPDWVALTTGLRFSGHPEAAREQTALIDELVRCGAAALLFGIGVHFREVPAGLRAAAEAAGFNLLTVDPSVPFLQIEQHVYASESSADAYALRRRLRIQEDLLEALGETEPVTALVHRIGALLNGFAVLYEESGRVVASTGQGPAMLVWSAVRTGESRGGTKAITVGRWHVVARPVALRGVGYWIAVGSHREQVLDELGPAILDATQSLLGAMRGVRALNAAQSMAEAAEILRTMSTGMTPETVNRVWERLRPFRFERDRHVRAFVAVPNGETRGRSGLVPSDDVDALLEMAQNSGLPLVLEVTDDGGFRGLAGDRVVLDDWLRRASAGHHVGLSEPFDDLHLVRARMRDAERALKVALRRHAHRGNRDAGAILRFEDVDMVTWLLASRSADAVAAKARQQLGDLLEREDLTATVAAWLGANLDVRATAAAMFLHPNSVRYRLRRVEEILGAPIMSAAVVSNLYLALHDRVTHHPDP